MTAQHTSYGLDRYSCSQSSGGRDRVLVFTKPLLVLKSSFNRPNIYYEVRFKDLLDDPYSDLCEYLKSFGNICSIVYCLERTTCDDLAAHLSKKGLSCAAYHAGLNSKLRSSTLDGWISFKTQVIVATVAFGARDQTKAIPYLNAFAISSLSSQIIKWVGREIGNESSASGPSGSSPRSFLRWMLNIENRGIKIFDDEYLKSRGKLILESSEEESKQPARWEDGARLDSDTLFYIDNKGEEEHGKEDEKISESMNSAFIAAAHSIQSSEQGRRKRKTKNGERRKSVKFSMFNRLDYSASLSGKRSNVPRNDDSNSGSEIEDPYSDEDMEGKD